MILLSHLPDERVLGLTEGSLVHESLVERDLGELLAVPALDYCMSKQKTFILLKCWDVGSVCYYRTYMINTITLIVVDCRSGRF